MSAEGDDFVRRLLVSVDAKGYSSSTSNWQSRIQSGILEVCERAATRAGLSRATWQTQAAGDGELSVLPETEPEPRVVDDFVRHLSAELHRHNRDLPENKQLRLRMAIHFGPAVLARNGFAGAGPIVVSRLCDSRPLRDALDGSGADLAVILSQRVFSETVEQEHTSLDPKGFRQVAVQVKEFAEDAWIWVPGHDIRHLPLGSDEPARAVESRPAAPSVPSRGNSNFMNATVKARKVVGGDEFNYGSTP
jgi:hypothetical protein